MKSLLIYLLISTSLVGCSDMYVCVDGVLYERLGAQQAWVKTTNGKPCLSDKELKK